MAFKRTSERQWIDVTAFAVWTVMAAVICGLAYHTGDMRGVVTMFIVSLLLPDDLFTLNE